jgi:hypothetical protein
MTDEHTEETRAEKEQSNGHHLGRAAVIAAASGATAYATRKALRGRSSSESDSDNGPRRKKDRSKAGESMVTSAIASGWDVAKDSLIPLIEDGASKAGAFVAERSPEVVRDVLVPRFISGFERARRDDKSED